MFKIHIDSMQLALQCALEAFGTRVAPTPVVMPVTSSLKSIAGVLRSGAHPVLLDVNDHMYSDMALLTEALEDLVSPIVILNAPSLTDTKGLEEEYFNLLKEKEVPYLVNTESMPVNPQNTGIFTLYDLTGHSVGNTTFGKGGLLITEHKDLYITVSEVVCGDLGHDGTKDCDPKLLEETSTAFDSRVQQVTKFKDDLAQAGLVDVLASRSSLDWAKMVLKVGDAERLHGYLDTYPKMRNMGVSSFVKVPLHRIPCMRDRWEEPPEYPQADKVCSELLYINVEQTNMDTLLEALKDYKF